MTKNIKEKSFEDPLATKSNKGGFIGFLETFIRRFRNLAFYILILPLVFAYIAIVSISLMPGIYYFNAIIPSIYAFPMLYKTFFLALALALGIFSFGIMILILVPLFNLPFVLFVKPFRGTWFSLNTIPWYYHNALMQLARYTVLDYITPTPLNILFFKCMGMKIGKGVVINTTNISDPCLIRLDDYVTIGGSATIFAHYGMKGYLIVGQVHIKKNVTLGLKSSIMGDVVIEEGLTIPPHTAILPKSRVNSLEDL